MGSVQSRMCLRQKIFQMAATGSMHYKAASPGLTAIFNHPPGQPGADNAQAKIRIRITELKATLSVDINRRSRR